MDNPDHGFELWDMMARGQRGVEAPLRSYLAAEPTRAVTPDLQGLLLVRHQFGTTSPGHWKSYSAQPDRNPWPGSPSRPALVMVRCEVSGTRNWYELTLPLNVRIAGIVAEGRTFVLRVASETGNSETGNSEKGFNSITVTSDQTFRVIADCAFGPPSPSEVDIARGFDKLAGRIPLDVVGKAEPDAILGAALPLELNDPILGWFRFHPVHPANYSRIQEDGPTNTLLADPGGQFHAALARARVVLPTIETWVTAGARLVKAIRPEFGLTDNPRQRSAAFSSDGRVRILIDDGLHGTLSADLELGADDMLRLIEIDEETSALG